MRRKLLSAIDLTGRYFEPRGQSQTGVRQRRRLRARQEALPPLRQSRQEGPRWAEPRSEPVGPDHEHSLKLIQLAVDGAQGSSGGSGRSLDRLGQVAVDRLPKRTEQAADLDDRRGGVFQRECPRLAEMRDDERPLRRELRADAGTQLRKLESNRAIRSAASS